MKTVFTLFVLPCLLCGPAFADDSVFAIQGDQVLTQDELDAAFAGIPEVHRLRFIRDGERVDQMVRNLLHARQIAAAARAEGFDEDPLIRNRIELAAEKVLAEIWMEHVMANAPEANYEALAEEYYLANPEEFMSPEMVDVSHILVSSESRSEDDALSIVSDIQERLAEDPARFDALVMELSEDPAKKNNQGRYSMMKRGEMVKPFEEMAFSLEKPGEISEPVKTTYGYHLIRLNQRMPPEPLKFENIKEQLVEQARAKHLSEFRTRYIVGKTSAPIEVQEGAVEAMAKRYFGENLELAPDFYNR